MPIFFSHHLRAAFSVAPGSDTRFRPRPRAQLRQFRRYLAPVVARPDPTDLRGLALTEQFARDPQAIQRVDDHADVIARLLRAGDVDTLFDIVASGLLHGLALQLYRTAIDLWLDR